MLCGGKNDYAHFRVTVLMTCLPRAFPINIQWNKRYYTIQKNLTEGIADSTHFDSGRGNAADYVIFHYLER